MKIQLGSGINHLEGWANYDMDMDITKLPLPLADNSVEIFLLEHCWEHITPQQAYLLLEDLYRCLAPGGCVRLCVPVLERLTRAHGRDIILSHGHQGAYSTQCIMDMMRIAGYSAVQPTPRKEIDQHWKTITMEKDDVETARVEGFKESA